MAALIVALTSNHTGNLALCICQATPSNLCLNSMSPTNVAVRNSLSAPADRVGSTHQSLSL